jgi:hypothetical protein
MLVVVIKDRLIPPQQVCHACLLADGDGLPRWRQGKLCCGQLIRNLNLCPEVQPDAYQCQMGFRLMEVGDRDEG